MRTATCLLALLLPAGLAAAQQPSSSPASLTGLILDTQARPLPFATALLLHLPDSAITASQATTEQGTYTFSGVRPGRYCVKALLLGYQPGRSAAVAAAAGATTPVPPLRLPAAAAATLGEVTVAGRLPRVEQHADRTVVNVASLNTAGASALEVLQQAPGVRLDKDDNLVYRGSTGVTVLIDGRATYMSGEVLKSYLKSLPAAAISQIELLPNPPASMDAAGTAGVLNIRLRRSRRPGLSGTATVGGGYGRFGKSRAGTNLTYNVGKTRLFARLDGGRYNSFNRLTMRRLIRDTVFSQENYWRPLTYSGNYAAGAEVALTPHQTLGLQLRGDIDHTTSLSTAQSATTDADARLLSRRQLINPREERASSGALNLNYQWAIDSTGRELRADADYVRYASTQDQQFRNLLYGPAPNAPEQDAGQLRSANSAETTIRAVKVDYVHPMPASAWRAELGAKTSWVTSRSGLAFEQLLDAHWVPDGLRTNSFNYDEYISAAYLSLSTTRGKLELKGGLRGELTQSAGSSPATGQRIDRRYFQLFPSAFAAYQFNDNNQVSASVSRRITRPSYQDLNPFLRYTDFYTAHQGNPFLAPALSQSAVVNYLHKGFQVLSLSYLRQTNAINSVLTQNDQTKVSTTMPRNLGRTSTVTLSSGGHTTFTSWWGMDSELTGSYNVVATRLEGQAVRLARFDCSISSDHTFTLPRQYQLLVGGYYYAPSVQGLFYTRSAGALNLSLKKQLWAEKANLSLRLSDVLATSRFSSTLRYANVNQTWTNRWESRKAMLTFTWKVGSGKTSRHHTTGSQDEEGRTGR